jgi:hypothetical protein
VKAKKQVARTFTEAGKASICFMCRLLELPRSSFYALSKVSPAKRDLEREIVKISEDKPRYGYRRVAALMRRSGKPINVKRVQRVRNRHGLQVRRRNFLSVKVFKLDLEGDFKLLFFGGLLCS